MCLNTGTLKTINFPFGTNEKLIVISVLILKNFRVYKENIYLGKGVNTIISLYKIATSCTCDGQGRELIIVSY